MATPVVSKYSNRKSPEETYALWFNEFGQKRCCTCNSYYDLADFHNDKGGHSGKAFSCKTCAKARSMAHHNARKDTCSSYIRKRKASYVKHTHGITLEEYEQKLTEQGYQCGLCGTASPKGGWNLDHNHTTGKLRDILCNTCNRGLGYFQDSIDVLKKAIVYLEKHSDN